MKRALVLALGLVLLVGAIGQALTKSDYRVYFTTESGTVIAGITNTGRLDTLLGSLNLDDVGITFGTGSDVDIEWTTADADGNCLFVDLPTGGATSVPVFGIGSADADFGYFNGVVEPTFFVENLAGSSYVALDFSGTTAARLIAGGSATTLTLATPAGADIVLDAGDATAGTSQTYVSITGTTPVHASGTPTDIFLDITPSITANTATATWNLIDLTFSSPVWASGGATSTLRGIYFAPTIGNASAGTNTVAMLDVAAITGDASVSLYGLRFGALTGTGATENAIEIGSGWDNGINTASQIDCQASIILANDEAIANAGDGVVTITSDDATGAQVTIIGGDHNTTSDAVLLLDADAGGDAADSWFIKSLANGNNLSVLNDATEVMSLTTAGLLQIDSDIKVDGGDINNTSAGAGIDIEPTMAAAGSNSVVLALTGTQATHASGTPTDIWLDFNPTFGINTVSTTANLADFTFTSPAWATGGATSVLRGLYFAPTIGNASAGTNTVALLDVAAITGDAQVSLYGVRFGALTGSGATEYAISIGAGWDRAIDVGSPSYLTTLTLSDVLTFSDAGSIDNTAADTLTITEDNISLAGTVTSTGNVTVNTGIVYDGTADGTVAAGKGTAVDALSGVHQLTYTFTMTAANDVDVADGGKTAGVKVYDFPQGRVAILGAVINASIVTNAAYNAHANDDYYVSVGTADGTQAADADLTGTEQDIIPKTTIATDTAGANTKLTSDWHSQTSTFDTNNVLDGTTTATALYVNVAVPDASNTGPTTHAITGTVTITYVNLGDY